MTDDLGDRPTIGYVHREWDYLIFCAKCRTLISEGVTHALDHATPPQNALCAPCYASLVGQDPPTPS